MKDQLIFDTTDANTIADSDSVGAFVRSSDGTLIDKATINSVERLAVDSTLKDGAGTALTSTLVGAKQALDVRIAEGINVEVDLDAADDSVAAYLSDGAGNAIGSTGGALDVNIASGSLTVTSNDSALANTAIAHDALAITAANTAESVVGTALTDRKYLYAYNADNRKMYIGGAGVTAADGFPISPGSYIELRAGASVDVQVVSEKAGHDVRTLELS